MKKRGTTKLGIVFIAGLLLVAILHTLFHISLYGNSTKNLGEGGVSGFAIGSISANEIKTELETRFPSFSPISRASIIIEWVVLVIVVIATLVVDKINIRKEKVDLNVKMIAHSKSKTDIDVLYDLLRDKKRLKLSTIQKLFNVKEETVLEWANILESSDLATLNYPRIGEAELNMKENVQKT